MRSASTLKTWRFLPALIGGLMAMLMTVVLAAPTNAEIIGTTNDLHRVPDTTAYPFSAVVEITLGTADDGSNLGACTGWMYAPNMVATAAHCVYDPAKVADGYFHVSGMKVWRGINGSTSTAPYGSCGVTASRAAAAYINGDWRFDYAALKLNCPVANQPVLNYDAVAPGIAWPTRVVGYPHNAQYPTMYPTDTQWYSDGKVGNYDAYLVYYDNDTENRMSGSPVMMWTGTAYKVVAIHSRGYNASYNTGPRITSAVVTDLSNWKYI